MTAPALFISDLHLDASRPDITAQFLEFLRGEARQARALYILGDLFEAWIGDDDPDSDKQRVQSALRDLTQAGVPCYVMHGNRDFLLGNRFLTNTGCQLLRDPQTIDLNGQRVLVLHGDLLCTDDRAYQRLRRRVRNPFLQFILRHLPLRTRQSLAAKMRAGSKAHIAAAMESIMDVNADAVARAFDAHDVRLMIHGHTHRPAVHRVQTPRGDATRIVLGDWYTQGSVLRFDDKGFELRTLTRPAH